MRKSFKYYVIIWIICFAIFNLLVFAIPSSIDSETIFDIVRASIAIKGGNVSVLDQKLAVLAASLVANPNAKIIIDKFGGAFWPGYIAIVISFIIQLICSIKAFSVTNNQKFFYNISLIKISYSGLIITTIVGVACMFIMNMPIWVGIIVCAIVAIVEIIALLRTAAAIQIVTNKDEEIASSTKFIKDMTAKTKVLLDSNKNNDDVRKLYEAFRYANPTSNDNTKMIDKDIARKINEILKEAEKEKIEEVIKLINDRNEMVKH